MAKYAKTSNQAARTIGKLQAIAREQKANGETQCIKSLGTARDYQSCLKRVNDWAKEHYHTNVEKMTVEQAKEYLKERSTQVTQKTLDQERHAIQKVMQHISGELRSKETKIVTKLVNGELKTFKQEVFDTIDRREFMSTVEKQLTSRSMTPDQYEKVRAAMPDEKFRLCLDLMRECGLRVSEIPSLQRAEERPAMIRQEHPDSKFKFAGLGSFQKYTVDGKGGGIRNVAVPDKLACELEKYKMDKPDTYRDRGINIERYYDLPGGQCLSMAYTRASYEALGFSTGAHGCRHSDAQIRMNTLQDLGASRYDAKEAVSQELGHFRPDITDTYLR